MVVVGWAIVGCWWWVVCGLWWVVWLYMVGGGWWVVVGEWCVVVCGLLVVDSGWAVMGL